MQLAPADCALCPRLAQSRRAVVNGAGPLPARVMVVAQNPGREEENHGYPLYEGGFSGYTLRSKLLPRAGIDPALVRFENVCRCRPPHGPQGDLPLTAVEVANCAPFLQAALGACQPEIVVTLGAPALRWFLPGAKLAEVHGRPQDFYFMLDPVGISASAEGWPGWVDEPFSPCRIWVVPMYHPAAAHPSRNPGLAQVMIEDWSLLGTFLARIGRSELGNTNKENDSINNIMTTNQLGKYKTAHNVESFISSYRSPAGVGPGIPVATVAFDYETNDPTWHGTFQAVRARPIGVALAVEEGQAVYWPTTDITNLRVLLESPTVIKVAHNATFEYIVSRNMGIRPSNLHCTKLLAYILRRTSTQLKDLSWSELGITQTRFKDVDWSDPIAVTQYAAADADLTLRLFALLGAEVREQGLWELYELERACLPVLAEMTLRGITFDPAPLAALQVQLEQELLAEERALLEHFNVVDIGMNLNSDDQLRNLLYGPRKWRVVRVDNLAGRLQHDEACTRKGCVDISCAAGVRTNAQSRLIWFPPGLGWPVKARTPTGEPAVDMDTLRLYVGEPVVGSLVKYKSLQQALENNVTRLPELVQEDGRIHPTFHQSGHWEEHGTSMKEAPRTGRLSSSGPNLQNVTHYGGAERPYVAEWARQIRRGFVASPGLVLWKADVGQEEPRIAALLAGDDELLSELSTGDVYCPVAALVFRRPITPADREERQIGKRGWMAWLNGAGPSGIQESAFWLTTPEALRVVQYLQKRHPRIEAYRSTLVPHLREQGYTRTWFGRRIYRPEIYSGPGPARNHAERSVMPDAIQGTAADVMKLWLPRVASLLPPSAHLLLTVHDEIVGECAPNDVAACQWAVGQALQGILPVPLPCEFSAGPNWADMVAMP